MNMTELIALVGILGTIALFLLKHAVDRYVAAIERIPPTAWFDRVERHLTQGHEHAQLLHENGLRLLNLERDTRDFEERIRALEVA